MKKMIGSFEDTPLWITFHEYEDKQYASIFFTQQNSPRYDTWYKSLIKDLNFKIIEKGSYRYGFYYKVLCSYPLSKMNHVFKKLKEKKFEGKYFTINTTFDEIYSRTMLEKL